MVMHTYYIHTVGLYYIHGSNTHLSDCTSYRLQQGEVAPFSTSSGLHLLGHCGIGSGKLMHSVVLTIVINRHGKHLKQADLDCSEAWYVEDSTYRVRSHTVALSCKMSIGIQNV